MIPAAATLATLAREAAEDVFDWLTADCSEPTPTKRVRNTMPSKYIPGPSFSATIPKLPADPAPTPPLPHAAPAPAAADAGELTEADLWWIGVYDGALAERDAERCRAEAAEAERDRLSAEVAALRGAMPDPGDLDAAAVVLEGSAEVSTRKRHDLAAKLLRCSEAIDAALATATPQPPAAEAVTGGGGEADARRLAWLASELAMDWEIGGVDVAGLAYANAEDHARETTDADLLYALRRAIDTAAALDAPQEADHAR